MARERSTHSVVARFVFFWKEAVSLKGVLTCYASPGLQDGIIKDIRSQE